MPLYANIMTENGIDKIVVSSVPIDSEDWENNAIVVSVWNPLGVKRLAPEFEINIVRNVLENGGAQVVTE